MKEGGAGLGRISANNYTFAAMRIVDNPCVEA